MIDWIAVARRAIAGITILYWGPRAFEWAFPHVRDWVRWHTKAGRREIERGYELHVAQQRSAFDVLLYEAEQRERLSSAEDRDVP